MTTGNAQRLTLRTPRRRAFTLAEAAISIMVVSVMLVVALNLVATSARARLINARLGVAPALAHDLMSEVLQARYVDPDLVPVPVEGPEIELGSYLDHDDQEDAHVHDDEWWAQYFKPTLPAEAVSWRVNLVKFRARVDDDPRDTTIELRLPAADFTPSATVIDQTTLAYSELTGNHTWITKAFANAGGLSPTEGLCITFLNNTGKSCQLEYRADDVVITDAQLSRKRPTWTAEPSDVALFFYVSGTVTTLAIPPVALGIDSPESNTTRADFDDVDDYHGWSASPPENKDGTQLSGYGGWTRAVTVEYVDPTTPDATAVGSDQGVKRITVVVTDPRGAQTTLVGLRSNVGVYEQEPIFTKTYVTWVGLNLQIGGVNTALSLGTALANEPVAN